MNDGANPSSPASPSSFRARAATLATKLRIFARRPDVARALRLANYAFLALIVIWLITKISQIGWGAVIENLPASPWFYFFLALKFLTLPIAETFVYQILWERPLLRHFPAFVRKRVYNSAVAGYSGEAFLVLWARRRLGLSDLAAVVSVKDGNVLAAFSANLTTVALVVWLAANGLLERVVAEIPGGGVLFAVAFAAAAGFAIGAAALRRKIIAAGDGKIARILGVHALRQAAQLVVYAAVYAAAIPSAPLATWFAFIALQYVITRIPFLPNQELFYLGAALSLAAIVGAPEEQVAGMLLAEAGLLQALYFTLFLSTAPLARSAVAGERSEGKSTPLDRA